MNLQGSGVTRLSFSDLLVDNVAWRPDGQRVIVSLQSCGYWDYYCSFATLMLLSPDDDSRVTVPLPADVIWINGITWSPDGTAIAFGCSFIQGTASKICSMRSDGSRFRVLTPGPGEESDPAWSPDGSRIAFASSRYGRTEILLMNPDGTEVTRLSPNAFGRQPAWSPDGTRLGYSIIDFGGQRGLMLIQADGSGGVRLTTDGNDSNLAWRP
jgi:Tol biopolymer transport system component